MGMLEQLSYGQQYLSDWVIGFWVFGFIALANSGWIKNKIICIVLMVIGILPVVALILFYLLPFAVVFLGPLAVLYVIVMIVINVFFKDKDDKRRQ